MNSFKCQICFKNSKCHCIQLVINLVIEQDKEKEQTQSTQLNNIETLLKELLKQNEEQKIAENKLKEVLHKICISFLKLILSFIKWVIFLDC